MLKLSNKERKRLGPESFVQIKEYCRRDQPWLFALYSGFTKPGTLYVYDFTKDKDSRWSEFRSMEAKGLKHKDFEVDQLECETRDGTKVPMFTVRHKDTPESGAPILQFGERCIVAPKVLARSSVSRRLRRL